LNYQKYKDVKNVSLSKTENFLKVHCHTWRFSSLSKHTANAQKSIINSIGILLVQSHHIDRI